ncbi:unnamed protein product, partial [Musa acuminata var. zebrina]
APHHPSSSIASPRPHDGWAPSSSGAAISPTRSAPPGAVGSLILDLSDRSGRGRRLDRRPCWMIHLVLPMEVSPSLAAGMFHGFWFSVVGNHAMDKVFKICCQREKI